MELTQKQKKGILITLAGFIGACGVALIVNLIAIGVMELTWFFNDPMNQWQIAEVTVPHGQRQPVVLFEAESGTIREATAYNAGDPSQTDGSPCITADGTNACQSLAEGEKICAANFVPLGSYLEIKGYGICRVADRMNSRFESRIDIAMQAHEKAKAVKFGLQNLEVAKLK